MANRKKSRSASKQPSSSSAPPARAPGARLRIALGVLAVIFVSAGVFVVWHRARDPARQYARRIERQRASKVDAALTRCFGGSDGAAIRRLIPEVRSGSWPAPFRACAGPALTEVVAEPMAFSADLLGPPAWGESARMRLSDKLDHLRGSLMDLQRATQSLSRSAPIPEERRDAIASALENVAVDTDGMRTSFDDTIRAVEDGASIY